MAKQEDETKNPAPAPPAPPVESTVLTATIPAGDLVNVRVNDKIAAYGGALYDPETEANPKPITKAAAKVRRTSFVEERIKSSDLVEIRK